MGIQENYDQDNFHFKSEGLLYCQRRLRRARKQSSGSLSILAYILE